MQPLISGLAQTPAHVWIESQVYDRLGKLFPVAVFDQLSRDSVLHNFGRSATRSSDDRFPILHCFKVDKAESFLGAWHHKNFRRLVASAQQCFIDSTKKMHAIENSVHHRQLPVSLQIRAATDHEVFNVRHTLSDE